MTVASTSVVALDSIRDKLGDKQEMVYEKLQEIEPATNEQIAKALDWTINRVTGRMHELAEYGLVEVIGLAISSSGRPAKSWVTRSLGDKQLAMFENDCY